jgi:hypothetical protein
LARRTAIFRRLVVLLDHLAPRQGAFQQAVQWAGRLQLPMQGICAPVLDTSNSTAVRTRSPMLEHILVANGLGREACAEEDYSGVCQSLGIRWNCSPWRGTASSTLRQLAEPGDLVIMGQAQKQDLLNKQSLQNLPAVLVCQDQYRAISRILVLNKQGDGGGRFLIRAAQLCVSLQASPIVLTVARSVREALVAQSTAQRTLLEQSVQADFDCLVGSEVRLAVATVANLRRCQLVMMERGISKPWWRWKRAPINERIMDLNQSFALLAVLAGGLLESVATEKTGQYRHETTCDKDLSPQRKNTQFQKALLPRSPEDDGTNNY